MCVTRTSTMWMIFLSVVMTLSIACSRRSNDERITKDIQDKVEVDPDTKDSQVEVAASKGEVTLKGKVKTPKAKKKVEEIAAEEPGTAGVNDQTMIEPEAPAPQPSSTTKPAPQPLEKPKPQPIIVPSGTVLTLKTAQALSSKSSQSGQAFAATLAQPVIVDGKTVLRTGADINGTVVSAKAKGKIKGQGELSLALTSISVQGQNYEIQTEVLSSTTKGKGKRTAATTGGGAAGGALIGGLAGGGKGAGIGALVGAGAGFIGGAMTGNKQVEIPAESALSFTLSVPLTLPPPTE